MIFVLFAIQHVFVNCKHICTIVEKTQYAHFKKHRKKNCFFFIFIMFYLVKLLFLKMTKNVTFSILYTKQYIYLCLKQKRIPTFCELIHFLKFKWKIKKYASIQKLQHIFNFWKMVFNVERYIYIWSRGTEYISQ